MCRLALLNKAGINHIENTVGLTNFFDHLEQSFGGHGNGYAIIFNDGNTHIKKGVKLDNDEITEDIIKVYKGVRWLIYHTRLASIGTITDSNCHPFKDHNSILAMNGTEPEVKKWIKDNKTDTEMILNMCNVFGVDIKEGTKNFNSVFLGYNSKQVFANRNNGSLEYLHHNNNTIIFASEFMNKQYDKGNVFEAPKTWEEGKKINIKILKKANKKISKYGNYLDYDYYSYVPIKYRLSK